MGKTIRSIRCNQKDGGCDSFTWIVGLDIQGGRVILDCSNCNFRISVPMIYPFMCSGLLKRTGKSMIK